MCGVFVNFFNEVKNSFSLVQTTTQKMFYYTWVPAAQVSQQILHEMHTLYQRYYEDRSFEQFCKDVAPHKHLNAKQPIAIDKMYNNRELDQGSDPSLGCIEILLIFHKEKLVGFTSLKLHFFSYCPSSCQASGTTKTVAVLSNGDTVVDEQFRGKNNILQWATTQRFVDYRRNSSSNGSNLPAPVPVPVPVPPLMDLYFFMLASSYKTYLMSTHAFINVYPVPSDHTTINHTSISQVPLATTLKRLYKLVSYFYGGPRLIVKEQHAKTGALSSPSNDSSVNGDAGSSDYVCLINYDEGDGKVVTSEQVKCQNDVSNSGVIDKDVQFYLHSMGSFANAYLCSIAAIDDGFLVKQDAKAKEMAKRMVALSKL